MKTSHVEKAVNYYRLMGEKNLEALGEYLHPNVTFSGPLAFLEGKEAVLRATDHFTRAFDALRVRAQFENGDQAMVVYDVDIPEVREGFPGTSLLTFCDGLIVGIELFYDGSLFLDKKEEIFS